MKVLLIEPPKEVWFVMGEYLPPPLGIIQLAAYLEQEIRNIEIHVLDCNAQQIHWKNMEKEIASYNPDVVASSALATCNTYLVARTLETAKKVNPRILTVAGGQHFTATAEESLEKYPEIDVIVRGEGEVTLTELVKRLDSGLSIKHVKGASYRHNGQIRHNPVRPLIENLDTLPYPGYHFVKEHVNKYHFMAMTGPGVPYALIEGSRGCPHRCTFCSQWKYWRGTWRKKSPKRVADEMAFCSGNFGSRFIWLADDNFGFGERSKRLADEILRRGLPTDLMWFTQARCDDVVKHKDTLPALRKSGLRWVLLGVESSRESTLEAFNKDIALKDAKKAVDLLKKSDIFTQAMFIIGERKDTAQSIRHLRDFADELDPDFAIFATLTPFPGTKLFEEAKANDWIEDNNWANYDMIHAVMPTEFLSRKKLQEELFKCYRQYYGSWGRRLTGLFSRNQLKRRIYRYMLKRGIVRGLRRISESV